MKTGNFIYKIFSLLVLLCGFSSAAAGAKTQSNYTESYEDSTIRHKPAKWFDLKHSLSLSNQSVGSFSDDTPWFAAPTGDSVQAAHTYVDTIYMYKGDEVTLTLPTQRTNSSSNQTYQRWYNWLTDGTFEDDILTPANDSTVYKLRNGYVGSPLGVIAYQMKFNYPSTGGCDHYVVACDVSGYTDFTESFSSRDSTNTTLDSCKTLFTTGGFYEPTIAVRVLFYIFGVDKSSSSNGTGGGLNRLQSKDYQGGCADGKYLEEYDITFPSERLSDHTAELVALSKDARSYIVPGTYDNETLSVSITSDSIELITTSLKGDSRIIHFKKKGAADSAVWKVPDGMTATILVTKTVSSTTYNIAKYNLTFKENSVPLTQTQIAQLQKGDVSSDSAWAKYVYRTPDWMNGNLQKLTELTFDYDQTVAKKYGQTEYFPFPLAWDNSSYAFFDGSPKGDYIGNGKYSDGDSYPEFSYYALVNDYMGYNDQKSEASIRPQKCSGKPDDGYFIYVDASDRPGILARLPFDEKLCPGSELFVSAWMKSAGADGSDDAAVLFTVFGVDEEGNETPIYRHSSSQIRTTTYLSAGVPGTGENTNDWYQLYFSFMNTDEKASEYASYILQVENNCASTKGGDFYLDDIKVYIAQPSAKVTQKEYTCTGERTHMSIELDWDRLMSRLGSENAGSSSGGDGDYDAIDFCFIDETKYNKAYAEALSESMDCDSAKIYAVEQSVVKIYKGVSEADSATYMTMYFKTNFCGNTEYGTVCNGDTLTFINQNPVCTDGDKYAFYRTGSENDPAGRRLVTDFYSTMSPNRPYKMLILIHENNKTPDAADFATQIGDACNIETRFYVTSEALLRVNGEVIDPSTDFCQGQIFNFSVNMRVPTGVDEEGNDTYAVLTDGVYFDWFFGTEEEFTETKTCGDQSYTLESALLSFRSIYPDATELADSMIGCHTVDGNTLTFTRAEYCIIKKYLDADSLVLHRENLDITLPEGGLNMVIQPIPTDLDEDKAREIGITCDQWARICWRYIPLMLTVNGDAPQLHAGFNSVTYPSDDFAPALRIGLDQIQQAACEDNALLVDLRGATTVTEGATHLGPITSNSLNHIYLVGSDDPDYQQILADNDLMRTSLPVGDIKELYAKPKDKDNGSNANSTDTDDSDYMKITFDLTSSSTVNGKNFKFTPKEGYTYTLAVYFEEQTESNDIPNTCYGSFTLPMKVVPKYVMWQGDGNADWNNDANWRRVSSTDLHFTAGDVTGKEAYLTDGTEENDTVNDNPNAFVPMLFTNVVMPENSRARLYMAGYNSAGTAWCAGTRPEGMGTPTENIQYDLMVYDGKASSSTKGNAGGLSTKRYRVNICDSIHFAKGAQILNAERLIYSKASMDIAVPKDTWALVSTPLKDVVAGDWYAGNSSPQADEPYFKNITFSEDKNCRLSPAVFQRSWDSNATIYSSAISSGTAGFTAAEAVWSSVYNDTYVPYTAGGGFSIQVTNACSDSVMFRLPKADTCYGQHASEATLDRTDAGRLLISGMADRSCPLGDSSNNTSETIKVQGLTTSQDGKYMIVGNPYMAQLNLQKFFAGNTNLESYCTETAGGTAAAGGMNGDNEWLSTDGDAVIEPYGAFMVKLNDCAIESGDTTVKFTACMQQLPADAGGGDEEETAQGLTITAVNESGRSGAVLAYGDNAVNGYKEGEDVRLVRNLPGNNADGLSVYTVAGDVAASINRVKNLRQVPLGVFAADGDVTTLTFTGTGSLTEPSLYDAGLDTDTPLTEGFTLTVSGQSHGRYFIRSKGAGLSTGITDAGTAGGDGVSVYSVVPRRLTVSSSSPLRSVSVYSVGGALTAHEDVADGRCAVTIDGVDSGVAVVRVATENGTVTWKGTVK